MNRSSALQQPGEPDRLARSPSQPRLLDQGRRRPARPLRRAGALLRPGRFPRSPRRGRAASITSPSRTSFSCAPPRGCSPPACRGGACASPSRTCASSSPSDRALTGVRISAQGHHVVVRDGGDVWNPESGQAFFDFELAELAREAATLPLRTPPAGPATPDEPPGSGGLVRARRGAGGGRAGGGDGGLPARPGDRSRPRRRPPEPRPPPPRAGGDRRGRSALPAGPRRPAGRHHRRLQPRRRPPGPRPAARGRRRPTRRPGDRPHARRRPLQPLRASTRSWASPRPPSGISARTGR